MFALCSPFVFRMLRLDDSVLDFGTSSRQRVARPLRHLLCQVVVIKRRHVDPVGRTTSPAVERYIICLEHLSFTVQDLRRQGNRMESAQVDDKTAEADLGFRVCRLEGISVRSGHAIFSLNVRG